MIKQLEVSLYCSASSLQAYSDTTTLKTRLQQLAMEIAKKAQQAKEGHAVAQQRQTMELHLVLDEEGVIQMMQSVTSSNVFCYYIIHRSVCMKMVNVRSLPIVVR